MSLKQKEDLTLQCSQDLRRKDAFWAVAVPGGGGGLVGYAPPSSRKDQFCTSSYFDEKMLVEG